MPLMVYAVGDAPLELDDARGLDAKPLLGIQRDGLTMVVSEHERPPVEITEANLRRFEEVVERLMEDQTVLPARFGTTLAEPKASLAVLGEYREDLQAGLDGVRDAVELGVQARWRSDEAGDSGTLPCERSLPGTAYLRRQLSSQRRITQIEEQLQPLRDLSRRSLTAALPRPDLAFASAYLVCRPHVERFVRLAVEVGDRLDDVELEVTGPWPPYSFVNGEVG